MSEFENENCGDSDEPEDQDPLFGAIQSGQQKDGKLIIDLGWAGFAMTESLGIEGFAGLSGFADVDDFYRWIQVASGSPLADWHAVQLQLFECAYSEPAGEQWCYMTWRTEHDHTALISRPVDLFCLRHTAWSASGLTRRAKNSARTRSYCEAAFVKANPDSLVTPQIMAKASGDGLTVTGILPGQQAEIVLDWPSVDLASALAVAQRAEAQGVRDICMYENGIGVELGLLSPEQRNRLVAVDRYYGGDIMLSDALAGAGIL